MKLIICRLELQYVRTYIIVWMKTFLPDAKKEGTDTTTACISIIYNSVQKRQDTMEYNVPLVRDTVSKLSLIHI